MSNFTRTSPVNDGTAIPAGATEVGGIIIDIIGLNGARVTVQISAGSLFQGFSDTNVQVIGTQGGFTPEIIAALGGGIRELAVRVSLFDGDTSPGQFDANDVTLLLEGVGIGSLTGPTEQTDSTGTTIAMTTGFGDQQLSTGWFHVTDPVALAQIYSGLIADGSLSVSINDVDPGDNFYDFKAGVDGGLVNIGQPPTVVPPTNAAPTATNLSAAETYTEDTPLNLTDIVASDVDGANLTVTLTLSDAAAGALSTGTSGVVTSTYNAATGVWSASGATADVNALLAGVTFNPASNFNGDFTVATSVSDGEAPAITGTKAFTGTAVNDAPAGASKTLTLLEDGSAIITAADLGFSDPVEGNALQSVTIKTVPTNGALTLNGNAVVAGAVVTLAQLNANQLVFTPAANANGTGYASLTFQVTDDGGTANGGQDTDQSANTLTFDVTAVNDAPVNTVPAGQTMAEDGTLVFSTANGNALSINDVDAGTTAVTVSLSATNGTLTLGGLAGLVFTTGDGTADGMMTFTGTQAAINTALQGTSFAPNANYNGPASVTISTNDNGATGTGGSLNDADTVAVTVTAVNDASVARDDLFTTTETAIVIGNVYADNGFGADSDVESTLEPVVLINSQASLVGTTFTTALGASVQVKANGDLVYTPNASFSQLAAASSGAINTKLIDSLTYTLANGSQATVTVVINGADNADLVLGTPDNDALKAGQDNDILIGYAGADLLDGGNGIDTASYAFDEGAVFINLTLGQGFGNAAQGDTYVSIENVIGTTYNDFIIGDPGVNRLDGGAGNDTLIGAVGPDVLVGGTGTDTASYEDNSGTVFVNLTLNKGSNNAAEGDTYDSIENLIGGLFNDFFIGDEKDNRLDGALGADTLLGAGGKDTFVFANAPGAASGFVNPYSSANVDTILDFTAGQDKIELGASAFSGLPGGALNPNAFVVGTAALDADDRIIYDQATGSLYYDADGNGAGAAVLFAMLDTKPAITSADFVIM